MKMEDYLNKIDLQNISMQTLAFIGDSVYNVYIRTYLASTCNAKSGTLHFMSIKYVSAKGQSHIIDNIIDSLSEEELAIYKRGRNTNIATISKHVDIIEYKKATGFEALVGYLYVKQDKDRLEELISKCINLIEEAEEDG